jgi:hypothetical protein
MDNIVGKKIILGEVGWKKSIQLCGYYVLGKIETGAYTHVHVNLIKSALIIKHIFFAFTVLKITWL